MKFGLVVPHHGAYASARNIATMARDAEAADFDSLWAIDHIVIPRPLVDRFSETIYEAFTTLSFLAGMTERVKLGTSVTVLPYRHPVNLAKQVATLDRLSEGRVLFGAAFGWSQEEYAALDVPYERRGRRSDEMLRIFKHLWQPGDNTFEGDFYRFGDFAFEPRPVQQPHPPIWIGGNDERAIARAVAFGDGWHPITSARRPGSVQWTLDDLRKRLAMLDRLATEAGRDPRSIARSLHTVLAFDLDPTPFLGDGFGLVGSSDDIRRKLDTAREIGLEHVVVNCAYTIPGRILEPDLDNVRRTFDRFAEEILPHYSD